MKRCKKIDNFNLDVQSRSAEAAKTQSTLSKEPGLNKAVKHIVTPTVLEHGLILPVQTDVLGNALSNPAETQAKIASLKPVRFPVPSETQLGHNIFHKRRWGKVKRMVDMVTGCLGPDGKLVWE